MSETQTFNKTYTTTDLNKQSGNVLDDASRGPVALTRRGKTRFVILSAERYERLTKTGDTRRAYAADDMPPEMMEAMLKAMADHAGEDDAVGE